MFPKDFHYYLFHFCPPDCSTSPNLLLLARDYCSIRIHYFSTPDISRIIILPETATSVRQIFPESSFYQKLLLRTAGYCCIIVILLHFLKLLMYYCYLVISSDILNHGCTSGYLGKAYSSLCYGQSFVRCFMIFAFNHQYFKELHVIL